MSAETAVLAPPEVAPPAAPASAAYVHPPLIGGHKTPGRVTRDVCSPLLGRPGRLWWVGFAAAASVLALGVWAVGYTVATGIGTWGLNRTVGWAFDITNFVFWVGIGHAGTLISAVLLLFRQRWRTSINRSAEAMTIFAVICAGLYPLIHMGRPWLAFWVFPYPNFRGPLWVNWRSALLWDVFAIGTYFTISLVFWYVGLIPDLATLRDRTRGLRRRLYGFFSLGWNGSARTWSRYEMACVLLASLATPLVVSVHSVVSTDFATSLVPGWHTTVLPPYFVVGAVFSGFAMVLTLMLVARKVMGFEEYITPRHVQAMCKILVFTGSVVGLAYATELFTAWYSGSPYEQFAFANRLAGPLAWAYWIMVACNVVVPQLLWLRRVRSSMLAIFAISILVNVGMWFERFVIIVASLERDYLPSAWSGYAPTWPELGALAGGFGLFFTLFLLFCRFLPMISMFEVKSVLHEGACAAQPRRPEVTVTGRVHLGAFEREADLLAALDGCRRMGAPALDAYTPYPVHGLDERLGIRRSRLPIVCFVAGLLGLALGLGFQYWSSAASWPLDVGGKPFDSLPAFVPVGFELTVLCGGLATALALLVRSRLWPGRRAATDLPGVTDDRFVLAVRERDAALPPGTLPELLRRHGAVRVWETER